MDANACSSNSRDAETTTRPTTGGMAPATIKPTPARTAGELAAALKAAEPRARRIYVMTYATASNHLLGRPNGYASAAVLADKASRQ